MSCELQEFSSLKWLLEVIIIIKIPLLGKSGGSKSVMVQPFGEAFRCVTVIRFLQGTSSHPSSALPTTGDTEGVKTKSDPFTPSVILPGSFYRCKVRDLGYLYDGVHRFP